MKLKLYIVIVGFEYYNSWVTPSLSMHQDVKQYIQCRPLLYDKDWDEEYAIIEKKAFENKEYIGKEYEEKLNKTSRYHYEYNEIYRQIVNFKQSNKQIKECEMFSKLNSKIDFSMNNISKDTHTHRYSLGIYVNRNCIFYGNCYILNENKSEKPQK